MNIQNIVREIKRENEDEKIRVRDRVLQALEEVERLKTDFLIIDKDIEKMILFGSLSKDEIESQNFDIDIAVKSKKYYQLVDRALQSEFKVDVIDIDTIHKRIKKNILEEGRVLYEKGQD